MSLNGTPAAAADVIAVNLSCRGVSQRPKRSPSATGIGGEFNGEDRFRYVITVSARHDIISHAIVGIVVTPLPGVTTKAIALSCAGMNLKGGILCSG